MRSSPTQEGFTLIELIVFIVVAGIFIPMAYIAFLAATRGSLTPEAVVTARFLAERKLEDITKDTYLNLQGEQAAYVAIPGYAGYQWRWTIQNIAYQGRATHGSPTITFPEDWLPGTVYRVGDYVKPSQPSVHFYRCVSLVGNPTGSIPPSRWQANTSYVVGFYISPTTPNNLSYRCANRLLTTFFPWQPNRLYALGDYVVPTTPGSHSYRCTGAGTSGAAEPSPWPVAGNQNDGTVTWTEDTNSRTTGSTEPTLWPTTPGDAVNDGSVTWVTDSLHTGSIEPAWPVSGPVSDGSLCWKESTVYKRVTVYVREPKGYEYTVNSIVAARPGAYP
jgi:hypothetical protein